MKTYVKRQLHLKRDETLSCFDMVFLQERLVHVVQINPTGQDILCQGKEDLWFVVTCR